MSNMIDLIVFKVAQNKYALNIESIRRIIQDTELTEVPNNSEYIDGIMNYEDEIIKILNLRRLVGIQSYTDELHSMFDEIKTAHDEWVEEFKNSLVDCSKFSKTTDPHLCDLGKWLDLFNSYDEYILEILKDLRDSHSKLHRIGKDILDICDSDHTLALEMFEVDLMKYYNETIGCIDIFLKELPKIALSLQKMIIYENKTGLFAIRIDTIEDIAHVDEDEIKSFDNQTDESDLFEIGGVLDLNGNLVNIIKNIHLPLQ